MRGAGFLAIWSDVERSNLTDYRHWLTREHTTERVTTDGFLASRVFRAARDDIERFFILYELQAPEVLDGPAYLARLNAPSPWSQRIMPQLARHIPEARDRQRRRRADVLQFRICVDTIVEIARQRHVVCDSPLVRAPPVRQERHPDLERVKAALRLGDGVGTRGFERGGDEPAHGGGILHHQHALTRV